MITVTCRNGGVYSLDPMAIERIETVPDTVVLLTDRTKIVVIESLDELLRRIRDHRAAFVTASGQLTRTPTRSFSPAHVARPGEAGGAPPAFPVVAVPESTEA